MELTKDGDRWLALTKDWSEKGAPKAAGFRWNPEEKVWWTDSAERAAILIEFAKADVRAELKAFAVEAEASVEASRAVDSAIEIPAPEGLDYYPFQRAGIAYAMDREATLFGDEMGLGKTIQAVGVINADESVKRVLVICPARLRLNWQREMRTWLVRPLTVGIADSKSYPATDVTIINYDILHKHHWWLASQVWDILIVDECHYIKSPKARRTVMVVGGKSGKAPKVVGVPALQARKRLFLTGTPIVNRPVELWPTLHSLAPATFDNFFRYAKRYCDGKNNGYGWDFSGASNLDELQGKLRSLIMVRRLKKDVLTELPAKVRQIIEFAPNGLAGLMEREKLAMAKYEQAVSELRAAVELAKASDDPDEYKQAVSALRAGITVAFTEMSAVRHETALAKLPLVIEHVKDIVEGGTKVVVFAHHRDVVERLTNEFGSAAVKLYGGMSQEAGQESVDRFQTDESVRVFVGSITAAGVGLTLTESSHVVFAELDWVPGNITQAEDRCHRIGQTEAVLVQHLVLESSLDATMAERLVDKQKVIDAALDDDEIKLGAEPIMPLPKVDEPSTKSATRQVIAAEAEEITDEQVAAVHEALRILAALDPDHAGVINAAGFNRMDGHIGHSLAEVPALTAKQAALGRRIVLRYHRQLGDTLIERLN